MNRTHSSVIAAVIALFLLLVATTTVFGATQGTPHDFRPASGGGANAKFPNLAKIAGANACKVCHVTFGMGGSKYMWGDDYGWEPTKSVVLPESVFCMGCHDGSIVTKTGVDKMPDPATMIKNHKHPMESVYPDRKGFAKAVKGAKGRMVITTKWGTELPLFVDEEGDEEARITCLTCHNPHELGDEKRFLRVPSKAELCKSCHVS